MKEIRAKTIMGAGWSTLDGVAGQGLAFVVFLLMARLLSPEDFGLVAVANLYVMLAQFLIFIGLGQAVVQFADLDDEYLDTAFWLQAAIGFFFFVITCLVPIGIASFFGNVRLAPIVTALAPIFLFSGVTSVHIAVLSRRMDFRSLALRTLLSGFLGGVVGIFLAWRGSGVWSLVWQQLSGGLAQVVLLWSWSGWRPRLTFSRAKARRLIAFGGQAMITDLTGLVSRRSDQYFVGKFLGAFSSGYYAIAARVSNLASEVMIRPLARVTLSSFSRLQGEPERFAQAVLRVVEMQSLLVLPMTIGLALLAPEVVTMLFGVKWLPAVPAMQVLLMGGFFEALTAVHYSVLTSRGHPAQCNLLAGLHLVINLGVMAASVRWGIEAVAIANVSRAMVMYPVELFVLGRWLGMSPWGELGRVLPLLGVTGAMGGVVYGVKRLAAPVFPPAAILGIGVVLGAAFFTATMFLWHRSLFTELAGYLRLLRRRPAPEGIPT